MQKNRDEILEFIEDRKLPMTDEDKVTNTQNAAKKIHELATKLHLNTNHQTKNSNKKTNGKALQENSF